MTKPAIIRKSEMRRAAETAKETGIRVEIKVGDRVFVAVPDTQSLPAENGIDYSRPIL